MAKGRGWGFAACALASLLWGCGFFFGKIALRAMSPDYMVLYRFLFATAALLPLLTRNRPHFRWREWGLLLLASFLGVPIQFLTQFYGLAITTVSHASLMVGTMPVILAVGMTLLTDERLDRVGWLAMAMSTGGAALIALTGRAGSGATGGASVAGDLLVVLSCVVGLFWILLNKRLMLRHSHLSVTAYGIALGAVMLLPWALLHSGPPPTARVPWQAWAASAASGVLCTAATTLLWNWGLTQVPAAQAGVLLNMEPLLGGVLGVAVLHERLGPLAWVGGGMILLAAVALTARPQPAPAEAVTAVGS